MPETRSEQEVDYHGLVVVPRKGRHDKTMADWIIAHNGKVLEEHKEPEPRDEEKD